MPANGLTRHSTIGEFELRRWAPLGGDLKVSLGRERTVLVGRNGAGKSLLLEGLRAAAHNALETAPGVSAPLGFACTIDDAALGVATYDYSRSAPTALAPKGDWVEHLKLGGRLVWSSSKGTVKTRNKTIKIPRGMGVLAVEVPLTGDDAAARLLLYEVLGGVARVRAGVPRQSTRRKAAFQFDAETKAWRMLRDEPRIDVIGRWLLQSEGSTAYKRLLAVAKRVGVLESLSLRKFREAGRAPSKPDARALLARILVDEVDLGLLADGTLRVLETIVRLVHLKPRQVLLIEEPETGIHPGLLERLLNEIDAFSKTNQVILSTHSPQVVSWAKVDDLRLVERHDERTTVRALERREARRVDSYLADVGTLGEYVYSGALDG